MQISKTIIEGVYLISPNVFGDERGYFFESFNKKSLEDKVGYPLNFVQDNESFSSRGVLRGFAFQKAPYTQAKLVRVTQGEVLDVVLDMRRESPTFGQHVSHVLTAENKHQVFIPRGCAHAFVTLSETATFQYKVDNYFAPEFEGGVIYNDTKLNVNWHLKDQDLIVSSKDLGRPTFNKSEYFKGNL
tara:strand:+ start:45364 stop:45924 length:561 start_codon:yes stop_codon:yes gene_type:complete